MKRKGCRSTRLLLSWPDDKDVAFLSAFFGCTLIFDKKEDQISTGIEKGLGEMSSTFFIVFSLIRASRLANSTEQSTGTVYDVIR